MTINIRNLRERLGNISQGELARKLGVTQATVSRLETGEREADGPIGILLEQLDRAAPPSRETGQAAE